MKKPLRMLYPLEGGGGSNQIEKPRELRCFCIPGNENGLLFGEKPHDLLSATFAKVVETPFVDVATILQQASEAPRATSYLEGAVEVPVGVGVKQSDEPAADLLLGQGLGIVAVECAGKTCYNSLQRVHR